MKRAAMIAIWSIAGWLLFSIVFGGIYGGVAYRFIASNVISLETVQKISAIVIPLIPIVGFLVGGFLALQRKLPGTKA
jgi:hypothetical protein